MTVTFDAVAIDCSDPVPLSGFWGTTDFVIAGQTTPTNTSKPEAESELGHEVERPTDRQRLHEVARAEVPERLSMEKRSGLRGGGR